MLKNKELSKEIKSHTEEETCDCDDCVDSDTPCHMDCRPDEQCKGCADWADELEDTRWIIDNARGLA